MNRTKLKNYAPQARRDFIQAMTDRAAFYGLTPTKTEPVVERGDVAVIGGREHPRAIAGKRRLLEARIQRHGFAPTMEAMAYTWFNRLVAVRFMELHGYLGHGYRVLSHPEGKPTPEIVERAEHVELPGLKLDTVLDLKLGVNKEGELYRLLLTAQCNALHTAMPFLFERIDDETELLLPDNLLNSDSLIRKLVAGTDEADWQEVEVIGWLYQFYISDRKAEVIGKVVASEDIPAATQLFTPNWIVKYLVQNTLGRQWLATYPQSGLRQQMAYYIEPAEQTPEVLEQLKAITPATLNPEELTLLDPACGSGHILVEGYDLFKAIYTERGYAKRDIPRLILERNLFGLEIDDRAAQLAAFALMMKARADDRRIFDSGVKPNVVALQDSRGLDAAEITDALNSPINKEVVPSQSLFEEVEEEQAGLFSKKALAEPGHVSSGDITTLLTLFEHAKTFGSLTQVPPMLAAKLPEIEKRLNDVLRYGDLTNSAAQVLKPLLRQAAALARQYDAVVANPPYMGSKYYTPGLKAFVNREYKEAKADLYSCFMERDRQATKPNGFHGMINIPNWMFLSSFEDLRKSIFETQTIDTFVHNGRGVFGSDFGSCAFVIRKSHLPEYRGSFHRLFEKQGSVASNESLEQSFHTARPYTPINADFVKIPGTPVAYWASEAMRNVFASKLSSESYFFGQTTKTANNAAFIRCWWEMSSVRLASLNIYRPFAMGGQARKWYGNREWVVRWDTDSRRHYRESLNARISPEHLWNSNGITWNDITAAVNTFRILRPGDIPSTTGPAVYTAEDNDSLLAFLGYLNSKIASNLLLMLNPTLHVNPQDVLHLPLPNCSIQTTARNVACILSDSEQDWNSSETSFDFQAPPIYQHKSARLSELQETADAECIARFTRTKKLEEANNRLFIDAYGLQDELSPEVPDDQITLYRPERHEDMRRLISYAVGCMMGRYSLDKPGLVYAHSGNQGFDHGQYTTFRADDDGIVPLLDTDWGVRDDATDRFVEFVGVAWPKDHLEENLQFVADSLGPTGGESPRDTIRRYLATGFYKHHLSVYKRRPIYWLFTSGKARAFQCLVYLHRYHDGTLARMRTEYVIPLQGQLAARIEQLEGDKAKASSTSHRKKLQKEQDDFKKRQAELRTFEEKLKHAADQKIALDLDDGVKVNYGKFGDLLAETKAVTGGKDEE